MDLNLLCGIFRFHPYALCRELSAGHLILFFFLPLSHPHKTGKPSKICANPVIQAVFESVHCDFLADSMTLFI